MAVAQGWSNTQCQIFLGHLNLHKEQGGGGRGGVKKLVAVFRNSRSS